MRTLLTGELTQAQDQTSDYYVKLEVQNGSGTWIDVGAALGTRWLVNARFSENIDQKVSQAVFTLIDRIGSASMAPLMSTSALNVNDVGAYSPLLDIGRLVRANVATMARGVALDVTKYREAFTGRIDLVDGADSSDFSGPITITCSDKGAWLQDIQIETQGVSYGSVGGTALETVIQSLLTNNVPAGEPTVTLVKQSTSSFAALQFTQDPALLFDVVAALVLNSTGEDLRYRYDASHVSQFTWFNPNRSRSTVDATFTADQAILRTLDIDIANVRNVIKMPYTDATSGATAYVDSTTGAYASRVSASIAKYRRRFNLIPSSRLITTATQAQNVVDAIANDLCDAPANVVADLPFFFWPVQLYDRYTFQANNRQYDQDQTFGVVSYQHTIENGRGSTTLTLTGRIVGAYASWLGQLSTPVAAAPPSVSIIGNTAAATDTSIDLTFEGAPGVGGLSVQWQYSVNGGAYTALSSTALPVIATVTRQPKAEVVIVLQVVQNDGQTRKTAYVVPGKMVAMSRTDGSIDRAIPWHDGLYGLKASDTSGNNANSTVTDSRTSALNTHFRYSTDSSDGVLDGAGSPITGGKRGFGGFTGLTGQLVSTAQDSRTSALNTHFRYSTDSSDGVLDGTGSPITGGRRGFSALNSGNRLVTAVDETATIGQENAGSLSKRAGIFFSETFTALPSAANWAQSGSGTYSLVSGVANVGANVLQTSGGQVWLLFQHGLPFNPSKLYRIRSRVRCTVDGTGLMYFGWEAFKADGTVANDNGGYQYVHLTAYQPTAAQGWVETTTWVKGASAGDHTVTGFSPSQDPTAPTSLNNGTALVYPLIAMGYPGGAGSGTGTFQCDYLQIDELDEDGSVRTYIMIDGGANLGKLKSGAGDSRGSAINTHYRYSVDDANGVVQTTNKQFIDPTTGFTNAHGMALNSTNTGSNYVDLNNANGFAAGAFSGFRVLGGGSEVTGFHWDYNNQIAVVMSSLQANGDIVARRAATTGVYYFGDSRSTYLYFDGTNFNFSGGTVLVGGNLGVTGSNYLTLNGGAFAQCTSAYNVLSDQSAGQAIHLGGTGDPNNYYSNTGHIFRNRGGGTVYGIWNAAGIIAGNNNTAKGLDLVGGGGVPLTVTATGGSYPTVGYNQYPDGSGGWKYRATDALSFIYFYAGGFSFYGAPSGTAGASLSPTQLFEVAASTGYLNAALSAKLSFGGYTALWGNGTYTMLMRPDGVVGIYVSNGTNYYDASTHNFRTGGAAATLGVWDSTSLRSYSTMQIYDGTNTFQVATVVSGSTAPTSSTPGVAGTIYIVT